MNGDKDQIGNLITQRKLLQLDIRSLLVVTDGSNNTNNILHFDRKCNYEAFYVDIR